LVSIQIQISEEALNLRMWKREDRELFLRALGRRRWIVGIWEDEPSAGWENARQDLLPLETVSVSSGGRRAGLMNVAKDRRRDLDLKPSTDPTSLMLMLGVVPLMRHHVLGV
jgi:hypothetical protein